MGSRRACGSERLDLIDALIDRAQPNTALQRGTPFLAQETQTLAQPTAKERTLIHIHPKAVVLLQDAVGANHIMPTPLAFDHWHLEPLDMTPTCRLRHDDHGHLE